MKPGFGNIQNVFLSGSYWTQEKVLNTFGNKIALWISKSNEKTGYYVNTIGVQEREAIMEGSVAGVIHPGRAISYDGAKSQYSRTTGNTPANFKLYTNSITIFGRIKEDLAPTAAAILLSSGTPPLAINGIYNISIATTGHLIASVWHTTGVNITSDINVCDGIEHSFFVLIDKTGNFGLYIDNALQGSLVNISSFTFNDFTGIFYLGGVSSYFSGIKILRDIRIWSSAITSESERETMHNGGYVAGCTSWWMAEEGKEGSIYSLKDCVGTNHLLNIGFDGTSLVSGKWESLLNKFGYSTLAYDSGDLIQGDGTFSDAALWTLSAPWTITGGQAVFSGTSSNPILNKRAIFYNSGDTMMCSFDIVEGPGTIAFLNNANQYISPTAVYAVGHHDYIFSSILSGTAVKIWGVNTGGAFKIDNFIFKRIETGILSPKMDAAIPNTDTLGRVLTFKDQAKYNLGKVSESIVNMPDYVAELFGTTEDITVNDWYNVNGIGNEINVANIANYQTGKQYWNANREELIIIKDNVFISIADDFAIKGYMRINGAPSKYRAGISFSMDDTWRADNWLAADLILSTYGWKSTFAITTSDSNTTNQQDVDQINTWKTKLLELVSKGHELGNHCIRHISLSSYLAIPKTRQQYYDDRVAPLNTIVNSELGIDITSFLYPSWYGRDLVMSNLILSNGFITVRENANTYPASKKSICYDGTSQIIYSLDIAPSTGTTFTDGQIIALLDFARDNNLILNLFCHEIVDTPGPTLQVSFDRMRMICQYINDNNMQFYKVSELRPTLFGL